MYKIFFYIVLCFSYSEQTYLETGKFSGCSRAIKHTIYKKSYKIKNISKSTRHLDSFSYLKASLQKLKNENKRLLATIKQLNREGSVLNKMMSKSLNTLKNVSKKSIDYVKILLGRGDSLWKEANKIETELKQLNSKMNENKDLEETNTSLSQINTKLKKVIYLKKEMNDIKRKVIAESRKNDKNRQPANYYTY